jgi:hypothetical protein
MARGSFFIQNQDAAQRHVALLAKGLKKVAIAGWVGGAGCTALAALVSHFLVTGSTASNSIPGARETSSITLVTWFLALTLLFFSSLYYLSGWSLERQKSWSRYLAAGTFLAKVLLCAWLGRGSFSAMFVFLLIASWDFYGLWVLLSKQTGQFFSSPLSSSKTSAPDASQAPVKPANLVT